MNEGKAAMTLNTFMDTKHISGVPGIAVRLGRALENWGREVSKPIDREALRRDYERQAGNEARMLHAERLVRGLR
jgi:hypothetical protein